LDVTTPVVEVGVLAVALAIDAAAVSAALGAAGARPSRLALAAFAFGLAQALMAAVGALGGVWLVALLAGWSRWIVCAVLVFVGIRMAREDPDDDPAVPDPSLAELTVLAVATSIDALAAGFRLPMLTTPVAASVGAIGLVTLLLSGLAGLGGQRAGSVLGKNAMRVAGGVLVVLGLRALW
jgi:putative Mn2+ efflux pump MntP